MGGKKNKETPVEQYRRNLGKRLSEVEACSHVTCGIVGINFRGKEMSPCKIQNGPHVSDQNTHSLQLVNSMLSYIC